MSPDLEAAIRRLHSALGELEGAIMGRDDLARRTDLETELQIMQDDRARLAVDLESATARLAKVENATAHVGRRVQSAVATLRDVLSRAEPSRPAEG
jgi:predicted  nucleic acid-binding Zn-ribbon protein